MVWHFTDRVVGGMLMARHWQAKLSRREREIMHIIYGLGKATAAEVQDRLYKAPSYSAVRAMLARLEDSGFLRHEKDGPRYVFHPTISPEKASRSALQEILKTFFAGSPERAVAALLDSSERLSDEELERMEDLIRQAKKGNQRSE